MSANSQNKNDDRELARLSTRNGASMVGLVCLLNYFRWRSFDHRLDVALLAPTVFAAFMIFYCARARKLSVSASVTIFWLVFLALLASVAECNLVLIERLPHFNPFGGFKITAMGLAVLAPYPIVSGYLGIGACALTPLLLYWTVLSGAHSKIPLPEPGITVVACVAAAVGLVYRLRGIRIERENASLRAEKEKLNEFARIILILRDQTNTPLQIIGLTTDLLRSGHIEASDAAARIDTSLDKLKEISQLLAKYQFGTISDEQLRELYEAKEPMVFLEKRLGELR